MFQIVSKFLLKKILEEFRDTLFESFSWNFLNNTWRVSLEDVLFEILDDYTTLDKIMNKSREEFLKNDQFY